MRKSLAGRRQSDGIPQRPPPLDTCSGQCVSEIHLAGRGIHTYCLRRHRRPGHRIPEPLDGNDIHSLGYRVKVDRLLRADHETMAFVVAPYPEGFGVAENVDLIPDICRGPPALAVRPLPIDRELGREELTVSVDLVGVSLDELVSAGHTALLVHQRG